MQSAKNAPEGIAHALTAICQEATGFLSLRIPKTKTSFALISKLPARPLFISRSGQEKKFQVINGRGEIILNTEKISLFLEYLEN